MPDRRRHGADEDRVPAPLRASATALALRDRLIAYLPRYAPVARRLALAAEPARPDPGPGRARRDASLGFSRSRSLPAGSDGRSSPRRDGRRRGSGRRGRAVRRHLQPLFEPENARAALRRAGAAGYRVHLAAAGRRRRPLCCGRTFLAAGLVDEARHEARRTLEALLPYVERGVPIVGLEPSCLLTLRDEFLALLPGDAERTLAEQALLFEEFLAASTRPDACGSLSRCRARACCCTATATRRRSAPCRRSRRRCGWSRSWRSRPSNSSCCGMAGAFGYEAEHYDVSMKMAELSCCRPCAPRRRRTRARRRRHQLPPPDCTTARGARRCTSRACCRAPCKHGRDEPCPTTQGFRRRSATVSANARPPAARRRSPATRCTRRWWGAYAT